MKKLLISSYDSCAGCRTCELLCSFRHEKEVNPELSRIKVVKLPLGNLPDVIAEPVFCNRCNRCVEVCPVAALSFSKERWRIELNKDKCTGCGECIEVCSIGAISMHPEARVPFMCDLCGGDPVCAEFCPTETLVFKEESDNSYEKATEDVKRRLKSAGFVEEPPPAKWKERQKKPDNFAVSEYSGH